MKSFKLGKSKIAKFVAYYRLKKAVKLLPFSIKDLKVLVICCGGGFDSCYLVKNGAVVTATDIDKKLVSETKKRCKKIRTMVADATKLPFKDKEFDVVWVNDGLHHLDDPYKGLNEMYRVAKKGFVFLEAQKTFLTPLLIKLGVMEVYEEVDKNYVYRFTRKETRDYLYKKRINSYKIYTSWCQNIDWVNKNIYSRFNNKIGLGLFKLLFCGFNFFFGWMGNSLIVVAVKNEK